MNLSMTVGAKQNAFVDFLSDPGPTAGESPCRKAEILGGRIAMVEFQRVDTFAVSAFLAFSTFVFDCLVP
jgi:hypothetical protein